MNEIYSKCTVHKSHTLEQCKHLSSHHRQMWLFGLAVWNLCHSAMPYHVQFVVAELFSFSLRERKSPAGTLTLHLQFMLHTYNFPPFSYTIWFWFISYLQRSPTRAGCVPAHLRASLTTVVSFIHTVLPQLLFIVSKVVWVLFSIYASLRYTSVNRYVSPTQLVHVKTVQGKCLQRQSAVLYTCHVHDMCTLYSTKYCVYHIFGKFLTHWLTRGKMDTA